MLDIDSRETLRRVGISGLRDMTQARFGELFSVPGKDNLFVGQTENLYLVSNDFPIGEKGWTEAARSVETRKDKGVVFAIMGGVDGAFDFWANLTKKGVVDQNGILILLEINPIQVELGQWKLDLVALHDNYPRFLVDFMPMPERTRKMILGMDRSGDWYTKAIRNIFLATSGEPIGDEWFIGIKEGMRALGYSTGKIDRLVRLIRNSGQLATNERGGLTRGAQGGILEPLTNYLLYPESRGVTWQNSINYEVIHRDAIGGRIKVAEMPLQKLPESDLFSAVISSGSVVGVHVSNVPQYLSKKDFGDFVAALRDLPDGDRILLQYFAVDTVNDITVGKVITIGETETHRDEIQMRNWMAGEIDER